jgi:hypothetical protein
MRTSNWADLPNWRDRLRLERASTTIARLPPRVICELLTEIGRANHIVDDVIARAELFSTPDADRLAAAGGDRFPRRVWVVADADPLPRAVRGRR